ncbi:hypothetical protein QWY14_03625 [Planococcus sp. N028]|uniref:Uncharacterized protein n=1 Tax=Planococcus shixiaomingii TaxID=3058393 RepID=A0ABT8MYZ6_9BACL|nr:hypothetical protein [Planococcus sp. N028]MDN7240861.1 hypothetical protein [Planococcus sp. N028]
MNLSKIESLLYKTGRILGDINAIKNGTIHQRLARRAVRKVVYRATGKIFKI